MGLEGLCHNRQYTPAAAAGGRYSSTSRQADMAVFSQQCVVFTVQLECTQARGAGGTVYTIEGCWRYSVHKPGVLEVQCTQARGAGGTVYTSEDNCDEAWPPVLPCSDVN